MQNQIFNTPYKHYKNAKMIPPLTKDILRDKNKISKMSYKCKHNCGINRNKKTYILCKCQIKSARYIKLKTIATNANKQKKIFTIYGTCKAVRDALLERGWIEKIPPNRMNLSQLQSSHSDKKEMQSKLERLLLSNFLEIYNPNFIWYTREHRCKPKNDTIKDCTSTIVNRLVIDAIWTSKQGLCSTFNKIYWFYIKDVAEVNNPRSYDVSDTSKIPDFEKDYKLTACTSFLRWVIIMIDSDKPIFSDTGKISLNVILFALNRCKEYIFRKKNKDIDQAIRTISNNKWNSFFKKSYSLTSEGVNFKSDKDNKMPVYITYAKCFLKEMHKYRPQLCCEGYHNIWIIKPAHCSRGRGIRIASKLTEIRNIINTASAKYVIQKYIEDPLLIYETKFDIRQYYLVTSTYPLVIWMYKDCYLKFSSQKYSLKNFNESIHLTNNAIQRKYRNSKERHADLPRNNMWDLEKYKSYLNNISKEQVWENIVYPGMKKSIVSIMLSCQDTLSASKNRFELYGCDFILDREYKPWLIEINSCPDLSHTTTVTAKICPAVISDIIKVVIDYSNNPEMPTGNFECIYHQPMTSPKFGNAILSVRGYSLAGEYFHRYDIEKSELYDDLCSSGDDFKSK